MNAVLLIRKYFFIVLLFFIAPTSAFSLDLICKYVEGISMELFDENNKSLGVAFGGKAKGMGPKRISISGNNCMVNNVKYKLIASDELFICTLKTRRKDWNQDQFISIDRYTGDARISSRLRAKANTINNMFEDRYTCSKGKAKKKF